MKTTSQDRRREHERTTWENEVLARLRTAAGSRMFSTLAQLTDCNSETVRRYMRKGKPSAFFMARLCRVLGISPEWLLWGTGAMYRPGYKGSAIETKPPRPRAPERPSESAALPVSSTAAHDPSPAN
jgi:hypothetical protein